MTNNNLFDLESAGALELPAPPKIFSRFPCVYFLILGRRVVYVGETVFLMGRLVNHLGGYKPKVFDRVMWLPAPANRGERLKMERQHIIDYWPLSNSTTRMFRRPKCPETLAALPMKVQAEILDKFPDFTIG